MEKRTHPLRAWRTNQTPKKTLTGLAADVSVTPSHLSEIENWKNEPSLDLAARLHRVTGIDMTAFVKNAESAA